MIANPAEPQQLAAPTQLDMFVECLPRKPSCANDLDGGTVIRSVPHALLKRYIQHNRPGVVRWLVLDIDRPFNWAREPGAIGLPRPAWITWNRDNRRAHVAYGLTAPVPTTQAARLKPVSYLAAVESALCARLGADPSYTNRLTKNPARDDWWDVWMPKTAGIGVHSLDHLARVVDLANVNVHQVSAANDPEHARGFGRNVALFEELRAWAYVAIRQGWPELPRWIEACESRATGINARFPEPLPFSEIRATAKSVAKWTHKRFSQQGLLDLIERTHRPELQAERGRRSGEARRAAREQDRASARLMAAQGRSQAAIAAAFGVTDRTVRNWLKN